MASIRETHIGETTGRCTLCGAPTAAYWCGIQTVEICLTCAVQVLPAILADAVPYHSADSAKSFCDRATVTYWRASTLRAMRERDAERRRRTEDAA